jgi:CRP/FNR family cyclic AMP-dependent transcriptional regulator
MDRLAERRAYAPGDIILHQGSVGNGFYLIESGSVDVFKHAPGGGRDVLGHIAAGGLFGEIAAIDHQPRTASVVAYEHTVCRIFSPELLQQKIAQSDKLVQTLLTIFTQNIRSIADLQLKPRPSASGGGTG